MCARLCQTQETGGGRGYSCSTIKTTRVFCLLHVFSFPITLEPSSSHRKEERERKKQKTSFSSLTKESRKGVGGWVMELFFSKTGTHALYVWYCLCAFPPIARAGPAWRAGRKTAARQPLMFMFYGPMSTHCLLSPFVVPVPN